MNHLWGSTLLATLPTASILSFSIDLVSFDLTKSALRLGSKPGVVRSDQDLKIRSSVTT